MTTQSFAINADSAPKLCFGGSFNPIHFGHLRCATAAARARNFGAVVLIPTAQSPHKPNDPSLAPAEDRLAMTRLAAEYSTTPELPFVADDLEIRRTGPSYTIDTVRELRQRGYQEVNWLIGADMLNYLPRWNRIDQLINEVTFWILRRPGIALQWQNLPTGFREKLEPNVVPAPLVDISATQIREFVRAGKPIDELTPPPVARYIESHRLYL